MAYIHLYIYIYAYIAHNALWHIYQAKINITNNMMCHSLTLEIANLLVETSLPTPNLWKGLC